MINEIEYVLSERKSINGTIISKLRKSNIKVKIKKIIYFYEKVLLGS